MIHLACFEPEIPQNTGTLIRTSACLGFFLHLIGPLGFLMRDKYLRRAHMDYTKGAQVVFHKHWEEFLTFFQQEKDKGGRLLGLSPESKVDYRTIRYKLGDILMVGSEHRGLGDVQKKACDTLVQIPMRPEARSLNMAISACLVLGEALRQTHLFPHQEKSCSAGEEYV